MSETVKFEDILTRYGKLIYPNKGVSMKPLLRQGRDLMVIERKGPEPCKKYDAVLFRRPSVRGPDDYVLHRILRINDDGSYWIVGDNCFTGDIVREDRGIGILHIHLVRLADPHGVKKIVRHLYELRSHDRKGEPEQGTCNSSVQQVYSLFGTVFFHCNLSFSQRLLYIRHTCITRTAIFT